MGFFDTPEYEQLAKIRRSGYAGWLDQDNKPVEDIDAWISEHAPKDK